MFRSLSNKDSNYVPPSVKPLLIAGKDGGFIPQYQKPPEERDTLRMVGRHSAATVQANMRHQLHSTYNTLNVRT